MRYVENEELYGLSAVREEVERVCGEAHIYRYGPRPAHLILNLDPGEGRTKLACWMTDMYRVNEVLKFGSGLDEYLEFSFDGTPQQMRRVFSEIRDAAFYENARTEPVFLGISGMAGHLNETQCTEMISRLKEICRYGYVVFFVNGKPSCQEEKLVAKVQSQIKNVKRLVLERYSVAELAAIAAQMLKERGIRVEDDAAFHKALSGCMESRGIATVQETIPFINRLVRCADFSGFYPTISERDLVRMAREEATGIGNPDLSSIEGGQENGVADEKAGIEKIYDHITGKDPAVGEKSPERTPEHNRTAGSPQQADGKEKRYGERAMEHFERDSKAF